MKKRLLMIMNYGLILLMNFLIFFFELALEKKYYKKAAFLLHQVAESLYHCFILVFTGDKLQTHSLKKLDIRCVLINR